MDDPGPLHGRSEGALFTNEGELEQRELYDGLVFKKSSSILVPAASRSAYACERTFGHLGTKIRSWRDPVIEFPA